MQDNETRKTQDKTEMDVKRTTRTAITNPLNLRYYIQKAKWVNFP